jgi:hypothetical protein
MNTEIEMKRLLLGAVLLCSFAVNAASYTGMLIQGDDYRLFNFVVDSTSNAVARTLAYSGGTHAETKIVLPSGFDPVLVIFDNEGTWLDINGGLDSNNKKYEPSIVLKNVSTDNYTAAIAKYSDDLYQDLYSKPSLDAVNWRVGDKDFYGRSSVFALDDNVSHVPIPSAVWLFSSGLLGLFGVKRKSLSISQLCFIGLLAMM